MERKKVESDIVGIRRVGEGVRPSTCLESDAADGGAGTSTSTGQHSSWGLDQSRVEAE